MQFIVPQFIDVENKIIGPISVRQFVTLLAGGMVIYLDYEILHNVNFWWFAITGIFIFALTGTFAFFKVNGQPFYYFLLNLFNTFKDPRLRVWNKRFTISDFKRKEEKALPLQIIPHKKPLSASKLTRLALIVDTGGAYQEDGILEEENKKNQS